MSPSEVDRQRFAAMDDEGRTAAEIAKALGVTKRTIQRWRHETGRTKCPPAFHRPPEAHERARQLLDDGCSRAETARTVGVTDATLRRWFPEERGWSRSQAGHMSAVIRWAGQEGLHV